MKYPKFKTLNNGIVYEYWKNSPFGGHYTALLLKSSNKVDKIWWGTISVDSDEEFLRQTDEERYAYLMTINSKAPNFTRLYIEKNGQIKYLLRFYLLMWWEFTAMKFGMYKTRENKVTFVDPKTGKKRRMKP